MKLYWVDYNKTCILRIQKLYNYFIVRILNTKLNWVDYNKTCSLRIEKLYNYFIVRILNTRLYWVDYNQTNKLKHVLHEQEQHVSTYYKQTNYQVCIINR